MINKYRNKKTNGYDSRKEANRAYELKMLLRVGIISDLKEQVTIELQPSFKCGGKTERAIKYIADFTYIKDGALIVEDVKSPITKKLPAYSMKRKMLLYKFPEINFIET